MVQFFDIAKNWVVNEKTEISSTTFYFQNSADFRVGLDRFTKSLSVLIGSENVSAVIAAVVGEIGNNSFDHNLGNWPDQPGVFFSFDEKERTVVLADRGQGVLTTLKTVRPELDSDEKALKVAFSEIVTSRAPEPRGNGLKFVRQVVANHDFVLDFYSGRAVIHLNDGLEPVIETTDILYNGCLAVFHF